LRRQSDLQHVYPVVPPKVEYGLTDLCKKIIPILEMMHEFGADYIKSKEDTMLPQGESTVGQ
jgi:DNA-binding HxlR family transcriptional regulator